MDCVNYPFSSDIFSWAVGISIHLLHITIHYVYSQQFDNFYSTRLLSLNKLSNLTELFL